ncbi:hypothetical protein OF83DRAFT_418022 [Amylostereum chailletii]|nr:hypothetical protein OF83DRAFT_418022 [Amylostereum chailletii]
MARLSIPCAATGCTNPGNKACRGSLCQNCCVIACLTALANGQSQSQCKVSSHRKATTTTTPPPPFQPQAPFSSASPTLAIAIPSASTPLPVPSASTAVQIPPASTSSSTTSVSTSSPPLSTQTSGPPLLTLPPHATARVPALPNTWQAMNPEWHATFEKVRDSRKEANARKRNTEEADRDTANRVELLIWRTVAEGPTGFPINLVDYPKIKLSMDKALLALLSPPKANDADSNTPEPEPATHVDVYNPDCGGRWDIWDVNSWCIVDVRLPHILLRVLVDGPVGRRFPASDYIGLPNAILSALEAVLSTPKAKRFRLDSISHTRTPSRHTISSAFPLTPLQLTPPAPLPIGEALSNAVSSLAPFQYVSTLIRILGRSEGCDGLSCTSLRCRCWGVHSNSIDISPASYYNSAP